MVIMLFEIVNNYNQDDKSMKCSISECKSKAIETVTISFRETRNLCQYHYNLFKNKEKKHGLDYQKASKLKP